MASRLDREKLARVIGNNCYWSESQGILLGIADAIIRYFEEGL
jgi:hypothetical protein